ncbi:MAG TPA: hypothetical protein PKV66_05175 [Candidatus Pelethenecus sp.]|nr:hypothetical protein [Candidatus Pelethenecus sp.]
MSKYDIVSFTEQHNKIVQAAAKVGLYLYEFCKALNDMKESKAYETAGYSSFEDYTLRALNIKKSQAYTYVKLANQYSKDFFQSTGNIGVTKLKLLAKLPEEEATAFIQENCIEAMSVKEVKRTLATYQDKKEEALEVTGSEEPIVEIVRESIKVDSFGSFVKSKRLDKGYSLKTMAIKLDMPYQTYQHVESGYRGLLGKNQSFYDGLIKVLELSAAEIKELYMWADRDCIRRKKLAPDLVAYATENPLINDILRAAKENKVSSSKLQNILKQLKTL